MQSDGGDAMISRKLLKVYCLLMILVLFSFQTNTISAQEGCNNGISIPTSPGNAERTDEWIPPLKFDPNTPEEIAPGSSIKPVVLNGCPPYTWSVSGTGYSLSATDGTTSTLTCAAGT